MIFYRLEDNAGPKICNERLSGQESSEEDEAETEEERGKSVNRFPWAAESPGADSRMVMFSTLTVRSRFSPVQCAFLFVLVGTPNL